MLVRDFGKVTQANDLRAALQRLLLLSVDEEADHDVDGAQETHDSVCAQGEATGGREAAHHAK